MKLVVYKGFSTNFLNNLSTLPLLESDSSAKKDILGFNKVIKRKLASALLEMEEDDEFWISYEEYAFIKDQIDVAIKDYNLKLIIYVNNLFPDYYPLETSIPEEVLTEALSIENSEQSDSLSETCKIFLQIYNSVKIVGGNIYASFYNYEYEKIYDVQIKEYYPHVITLNEITDDSIFTIFLNEDIENYLKDLQRISEYHPDKIGYKSTNGLVSNRTLESLKAYCQYYKIPLYKKTENIVSLDSVDEELIRIAKEEICIPKFKEFRKIKFYKNPDKDNEVVNISQAQIIREIISQAEFSYNENDRNTFRDIFITASTGAGKSVMFQIPAVYLAQKFGKLTIIIEPVKALMQDQKEQLEQRGYHRVETFNSDLISQSEKEAVLRRVKSGEVDLLYLSPETLLSYSIETLIGDREIALIIVDEAHIVTTWGVGFRPDYWYLGGYINNIRNGVQTRRQKNKKHFSFPICAFTATAVNGGIDDTISETVISLYMENPIKYLGYAKRDNISFDIQKRESKKLAFSHYEKQKAKFFAERIRQYISRYEKTIVYFPYAVYAKDALRKIKEFSDAEFDRQAVALYTGRNTEEKSIEEAKRDKLEAFRQFRSGEKPIMFATKAFGMGVDINDIKNVYHYAVTGNLGDYVQEIGRAARKQEMQGVAATDYFYNDLTFMQRLFGMSQIRQYQIDLVLSQIYNIYRSKNYKQNFLISPEAFTYIFNGDLEGAINKLKTCLLMLEKDLYDKYNFKVLISRPQSIFTKAFVVIPHEYVDRVLQSKYGKCFKYMDEGRKREKQPDGSELSDRGNVYKVDLKYIWEENYRDISFPQFKYWYFNSKITSTDKIDIMPEINQYYTPRQYVTIKTNGDVLLCDLKNKILEDFEFIADSLYKTFGKSYFEKEDFSNVLSSHFGRTRARVISNSLFEVIDPDEQCIKHRAGDDAHNSVYTLSNGTFKERLRKPIVKSKLLRLLDNNHNNTYSQYILLDSSCIDAIALKLLSMFDYITYEVVGGEEPEIFIRLNDAEKIRRIVMKEIKYSNSYVTKARQKHDRDVKILVKFFNDLTTDEDRWDYIEQYFLGHDLLIEDTKTEEKATPLSSAIEKEKSYSTDQYSRWSDMLFLFDEKLQSIILDFENKSLPIPHYLHTSIKKKIITGEILMCWDDKDVVVFDEAISKEDQATCEAKGWKAFYIYDLNIDELKAVLS